MPTRSTPPDRIPAPADPVYRFAPTPTQERETRALKDRLRRKRGRLGRLMGLYRGDETDALVNELLAED